MRKMEKITFKSWWLTCLLCLFSFSISACSSEDEEQVDLKEFSIVGAWQNIDDEGEKFIFKSNGICHEWDKGNDMGESRYTLDLKAKTLTIYSYSGSYLIDDVYNISNMRENSFTLSYTDYLGEYIVDDFVRISF